MKTASATQQLSPETWALLACAQAVVDERRLPAFREAVAACTSAERLCSAAIVHGMVGHLHRLIAAQQRIPRSRRSSPSRWRGCTAPPCSATCIRRPSCCASWTTSPRARASQRCPSRAPRGRERLYGDRHAAQLRRPRPAGELRPRRGGARGLAGEGLRGRSVVRRAPAAAASGGPGERSPSSTRRTTISRSTCTGGWAWGRRRRRCRRKPSSGGLSRSRCWGVRS